MRTTLTIDDDVLQVAKELAARQKRSVGEVISELARRGVMPKAVSSSRERNGVPLLQGRRSAQPVTLELVNKLRDETI